jgi:hypothetical protein
MRFLIICGDIRTLLRRKAGDNSVEPVAVTGRIEPLLTIIDEVVGYRGKEHVKGKWTEMSYVK